MTTIAYDGATVAADRLVVNDGHKRTATKLFQHGHEVLAVNGPLDHGMMLVAWYQAGAKTAEYPHAASRDDAAYLTVFAAGQPVREYEGHPVPLVFVDAKFATGSGKEAAMGAMLAGATAVQAVHIASMICEGTGPDVDYMEWKDVRPGEGRGCADAAAAGPADAAHDGVHVGETPRP